MEAPNRPYHWWKHDFTQRNSIAARRFEHKFGINTGYGIYNKLLEIMLHSGGCICIADLDLHCDEFGFDEDMLRECLTFACEYGIFYQSDDGFGSCFIDEVINSGKVISEKRSQAAKGTIKVPEPTNPPETGLVEKPEKKTKEKPDDIPEDEDIAVVKSAIQAMLKHGDNVSGLLSGNKKSTLTNAEIRKLIDRYGIDLLLLMIDEFYLWKLPYSKVIKSDYMSIIKGWVEENARKKLKDKPTKKGLF